MRQTLKRKKLHFALGFIFCALVLTAPAQNDPKITGKPINMILPQQKDSAIAFRMTGFIYGDQKGIRLVTNEQTKSLLLLLQPEFDIGGCIKSQKFVATHDGVYHFDAKVNLLYSIEDRTKFFRWYLQLMNGNKIIEEIVLTGPSYSYTAQHEPSPQHTLALNTTVFLRKGDVVSLWYRSDADPGAYAEATFICFSGFKVTGIIPTWTRPDIR